MNNEKDPVVAQVKQVLSPKGEVWATAPDSSWKLYSEQPEEGSEVEACWSTRFVDPPAYQFANLSFRKFGHGTSVRIWWANEQGSELLLAPDFWRPRSISA